MLLRAGAYYEAFEIRRGFRQVRHLQRQKLPFYNRNRFYVMQRTRDAAYAVVTLP
jgi:hypothetical protein